MFEQKVELEAQQTVVVVDDDPWVLRAVVRLLTELGYHTISFGDSRAAACEIAGMTGVRAVIVDLHMPFLDGAELARALHDEFARSPGALAPPILLLSADAGRLDSSDRSLFHAILNKPIARDALGAAVAAALEPEPEESSGVCVPDRPARRAVSSTRLTRQSPGDGEPCLDEGSEQVTSRGDDPSR